MSAPTIAFRDQIRESDGQAIREILESTGFFHPYEVDTAVELARDRLRDGPASGYHFLFVEEGARSIGYACFGPIACTESSYDLFWIGVHAEARGHGIGKALLARVEETIRAMGGRRIYVETSSKDQYQPTRMFYLRCGYQEEAVLKDFYAPGDGKVIYVKAVE